MMRTGRDDIVNRFIKRRPLALFAACYLVGLTIGLYAKLPVSVWTVGSGVVLAALIVLKQRALVFGLAILLGALMISIKLDVPTITPSESVNIQGRIATEPKVGEESMSLRLTAVTIDGESAPSGMWVSLYHGGEEMPPLQYGAVIAFTGRTWIPDPSRGPGLFDFQLYLKRYGVGIGASGSAKSLAVLSEPGFSIIGFSLDLRARFKDILEQQYPKHAPIMIALLLGDRSEIDPEIQDNFKRAGIIHILALSGLHIACFAMLLDWLLRAMRLPIRTSYLIVCLILLCYAILVGLPASVIRALIMYALIRGGHAFGRPGDSLTGLAAAFLLLTAINPLEITSAGMVLSFSAVFGILCLTPRFKGRIRDGGTIARRALRFVNESVAVTLGAVLGMLPASVLFFHTVEPFGVLTNIVAIPLVTLALPLGLVGMIIGLINPLYGLPFARVAEFLVDCIVRLSGWVAPLPYNTIYLPTFPTWIALLYAGCVFAASNYTRLRRGIRHVAVAALPALCIASVLVANFAQKGGLELVFLGVGQADATVVQVEGSTVLIDVGSGSDATDYLLHTGRRADKVFLSHPHTDHAGGLAAVLELSRGTLYLPYGWEDVTADESVNDTIAWAEAYGWAVEFIGDGEEIALSPEVMLRALHPPPDHSARNANDISSVLLITYGDGSALFTGDLPASGETIPFPDCDVLKVPHHGSRNSVGAKLIHLTTPSVAVIPVGRNSYGHPSDEVIARLEAAGARVYRTDTHGTVTVRIETDGTTAVSTWFPFQEGA